MNAERTNYAHDFYEAMENDDVDGLTDIVYSAIWELIRGFREKTEDVKNEVQIWRQLVSRAKNLIPDIENSMGYQLGLLSGAVLFCEKTLQDEQESERIDSLLAKHRARAVQILKAVRQYADGWGVQHSDLAQHVGLTPSNLSNHMKYLLEAGVVQVRRIGKNAIYTLSDYGEEYLNRYEQREQTQKKETADLLGMNTTDTQLLERLKAFLVRILTSGGEASSLPQFFKGDQWNALALRQAFSGDILEEDGRSSDESEMMSLELMKTVVVNIGDADNKYIMLMAAFKNSEEDNSVQDGNLSPFVVEKSEESMSSMANNKIRIYQYARPPFLNAVG